MTTRAAWPRERRRCSPSTASHLVGSRVSCTPRPLPRTPSSKGSAHGLRSSRRRGSATFSRCGGSGSPCSTTSSTRARSRSFHDAGGTRSRNGWGREATCGPSLDEAAVHDVARRLCDDDIEAVAIALLHSYVDDTHERRVEEIVRAAVGEQVYVTRSSEILPEIREYEQNEHRSRQRLRRPGDHPLPRLSRRAAPGGGHRGRAGGDAVERGDAVPRDGRTEAGASDRVGSGGGRDGVQPPRPAHRTATADLARHGWHDREGRDRRGRSAGPNERIRGGRGDQSQQQARQGWRPSDQAPVHRRLRDRRRWRQHRRDRRARDGQRRPGQRRIRARAGVLRHRRHRADPHGRIARARLPRRASARRRCDHVDRGEGARRAPPRRRGTARPLGRGGRPRRPDAGRCDDDPRSQGCHHLPRPCRGTSRCAPSAETAR